MAAAGTPGWILSDRGLTKDKKPGSRREGDKGILTTADGTSGLCAAIEDGTWKDVEAPV